jgi:hypothetical protein
VFVFSAQGNRMDDSAKQIFGGADEHIVLQPQQAPSVAALRAANLDVAVFADVGMDPCVQQF